MNPSRYPRCGTCPHALFTEDPTILECHGGPPQIVEAIRDDERRVWRTQSLWPLRTAQNVGCAIHPWVIFGEPKDELPRPDYSVRGLVDRFWRWLTT